MASSHHFQRGFSLSSLLLQTTLSYLAWNGKRSFVKRLLPRSVAAAATCTCSRACSCASLPPPSRLLSRLLVRSTAVAAKRMGFRECLRRRITKRNSLLVLLQVPLPTKRPINLVVNNVNPHSEEFLSLGILSGLASCFELLLLGGLMRILKEIAMIT